MIAYLFAAAIGLTLALHGNAQADTPPLKDILRAKDQALLDAIAPGDKSLWEKLLTSDAVYIDENGVVMGRAAFLAELKPLPPGASGSITITDYKLTQHGNTALVVHTDDERENYHGQLLQVGYLMSEVWRREGGEWKLALVHAYVVNKDPKSIPLPAHQLQDYVGRYRLGAQLVYVITLQDGQLMGGREGRPQRPVLVEITDVLFTPGQPRSRKLMQRNEKGLVTGFRDRREGEDLVWTRDPDR